MSRLSNTVRNIADAVLDMTFGGPPKPPPASMDPMWEDAKTICTSLIATGAPLDMVAEALRGAGMSSRTTWAVLAEHVKAFRGADGEVAPNTIPIMHAIDADMREILAEIDVAEGRGNSILTVWGLKGRLQECQNTRDALMMEGVAKLLNSD